MTQKTPAEAIAERFSLNTGQARVVHDVCASVDLNGGLKVRRLRELHRLNAGIAGYIASRLNTPLPRLIAMDPEHLLPIVNAFDLAIRCGCSSWLMDRLEKQA